MNLGFYGHTNTLVFTYTLDGKFNKIALDGGMRNIYHHARLAIENNHLRSLNMEMQNSDSDEYRRDYYGLRIYETADSKDYYGISRYLGYEDGVTPGDIFSVMPEDPDAPIDMLFVWDEGYGNLKLPECGHVIWASDKALPDREQFDKVADRCFLIIDGNVLRKAGAMISRQISWERTASELVAEIQSNPAISYLFSASKLLIPFESDGAVFIVPKNKNGQLEASLILTHGEIEGAISNKHPGQVANIIAFTVMTLGVMGLYSVELTNKADISPMIQQGDIDIFAMVLDTLLGTYEAKGLELDDTDTVKWGRLFRQLLEVNEGIIAFNAFSVEGIVNEGNNPQADPSINRDWPAFPIPFVPDSTPSQPLQVPSDWTVINSVGNRQIYDIALEYVQSGAAAIEGLPWLSLGALTTVDRWEIESYQNIRNLILDYANASSVRPLSIAVFGSPGSGKSFGVTQIAMNILPGKIEKLEFNVSQFVSPMDLGVAFQKVRDVILEGKLPLVFFDEFDSDKDGVALGWIKSFLMPMQDGRFRDDSGVHPLGKCILVFAGGTAPDFESFSRIGQDFQNAKGPDFISRLRGTINVVGPNPKNRDDQNHVLRRALLLRSLCQRERRLTMKGGAMPVSPGIIQAMLMVPEFKHGARSMEAILDMSRIEGGVWEPAALPFHTQLALHVDADAFLRLVADL